MLAALLRRDGQRALPVLAERIDTATDVLRLLWAWSGAEPDLLPATARRLRLCNLSRPLRRELLAILDAMGPAALAEDLRRHRSAWLRAASCCTRSNTAAASPPSRRPSSCCARTISNTTRWAPSSPTHRLRCAPSRQPVAPGWRSPASPGRSRNGSRRAT